jgi:hypothetical protein
MTPILDETHFEPGFLTSSPEDAVCAQLPIFTSASDIRELVQYLQKRPGGINVAEELDKARKRLFEDRKLSAYELLGITTRTNGSLRLSALGRKFAKDIEPEEKSFRHLLEHTLPYWTALKWIHQQNLDVVAASEILGFWQEFHAEAVNVEDQEAMRGAVVPFFSLCQAAALGTMTLGKRGHTTRLCIDRDQLTRFLEGRSSSSLITDTAVANEYSDEAAAEFGGLVRWQRRAPLRILILQSANTVIVELIRRTLALAHTQTGTREIAWQGKASLDQGLCDYPAGYNAVVVILDEGSFSPDAAGKQYLKEKVLMEIGAAHVLYNGRVVLLADRKFQIPHGIQDLIYYEFENDSLDWEVGLQLISIAEDFKNDIRQSIAA